MDHSDTEDSDKSDSSDSEYGSDEEHKPKSSGQDEKVRVDRKRPRANAEAENKDSIEGMAEKSTPASQIKEKQGSNAQEEAVQEKPRMTQSQPLTDKPKTSEEGRTPHAASASAAEQDSDSERELVIDLGDEHGARDSKRPRKDTSSKTSKETNAAKLEGKTIAIGEEMIITFHSYTVTKFCKFTVNLQQYLTLW